MGEIRGDTDEEAKRVLEPASSEGVPLRVLPHVVLNALHETERPLFDPTMARRPDVRPAAAR